MAQSLPPHFCSFRVLDYIPFKVSLLGFSLKLHWIYRLFWGELTSWRYWVFEKYGIALLLFVPIMENYNSVSFQWLPFPVGRKVSEETEHICLSPEQCPFLPLLWFQSLASFLFLTRQPLVHEDAKEQVLGFLEPPYMNINWLVFTHHLLDKNVLASIFPIPSASDSSSLHSGMSA